MQLSQLSVILTTVIKPEHRELFAQHVEARASAIRQQKGCMQLLVFEDADDSNKFIAFQTWEKTEYWLAHLQTQAARDLTEMVKTCSTSFTIEKMMLHNL